MNKKFTFVTSVLIIITFIILVREPSTAIIKLNDNSLTNQQKNVHRVQNSLNNSILNSNVNNVDPFEKTPLIRKRKAQMDPVEINEHLLLGDNVKFSLFKDVVLEGNIVKKDSNKLGTIAYVVKDQNSNSTAYITLNDERLVISFDGDNKSYRYIHSEALNSHYALQIDLDKMPKGQCACNLSSMVRLKSTKNTTKTSPKDLAKDVNSQEHIIDYMIVYTESSAEYAADNFGGIENAISQSQIRANYSLEISETNTILNLVSTYQVSYNEPSEFYTDQIEYDLYALDDPNDGVMDEIHTIREEVGADLVSMFVNNLPEDYYGYYTSGIAWAPSNNYPFSTDQGFSVCEIYDALTNTFIHEIGHNLGCQHSREVIGQPNASNPENAVSPAAYGYEFTGNDGQVYTTIMGYSDIFVQEVSYFSNPTLEWKGSPMGRNSTPMSNNSEVIRNISANIVKNYFSAVEVELNVVNGTGGGEYTPGEFVNITANEATNGQIFSHWSSNNGGEFLDPNKQSTTFTIPSQSTTITANYAFNIDSVQALVDFSKSPDKWGDIFTLSSDIDASLTGDGDQAFDFTPIGNDTTKFTGVFKNPNKYVISNLSVNKIGVNAGFFGHVDNAKISDLNLENVNITSTENSAGIVVEAYNGSEIDSCFVTGSIISSGEYSGGIVAIISDSNIDNCKSLANISGAQTTGGLVGSAVSTNINDSSSSGIILGTDKVGGLIGEIENCIIYSNSFYGEVYSDIDAGGLIAFATNNSDVQRSLAIGKVFSGNDSNGAGLVANLNDSSILDCFSKTDVETTGLGLGGGLVASSSNSSISNSYYAGLITAQTEDFVGQIDDLSVISNSFFDTDLNDDHEGTNIGVQYLDTNSLKTSDTYTNANWNFSDIWIMDGYPFIDDLREQIIITYDLQGGNLISGDLEHSFTRGTTPEEPIFSPPTEMIFIGWDVELDNIYTNTAVNAQYEEIQRFVVNFNLNGGQLIDGDLEQNVIKGNSPSIPIFSPPLDMIFTGWDITPENILGDTNINAVYKENDQISITFNLNGGNLIEGELIETITKGESATPPSFAPPSKKYFYSWDKSLNNLNQSTTITAIYKDKVQVLDDAEDGLEVDWFYENKIKYVENVNLDNEGRVLHFKKSNVTMLIPINISDNFDSLSWRASFKKFLITINYTSTNGSRTIHYFSSKKSRYRKGIYYKALGKPLKNQWMSVERNFNEDTEEAYPGEQVVSIDTIQIKASGYFDDLNLGQTTFENAEDGSTERWITEDRFRPYVNTYSTRNYIKLNASKNPATFKINSSDSNFSVLNWSSFGKLTATVEVITESGPKLISYKAGSKSKMIKGIYTFALGKFNKRNWVSFNRNIYNDLQVAFPGEVLTSIESITFKGKGGVDDIGLQYSQ